MSSACSETEALNSNSSYNSRKLAFSPRKRQSITRAKTILLFAGVIAVAGVIVLAMGIVLLNRVPTSQPNSCATSRTKASTNACEISAEMRTSGLLDLFRKIDDTFYQLHPYETPYRFILGRNSSYVKNNFKPFNPNPRHLKRISDTAKSLLKELNALNFDTARLKLREMKEVAQTKHFLAHSFGNPYDYDYYAGVWMLGPNRFCYLQVISKLGYHLRAFVARFQPKTLSDLDLIMSVLRSFGRGINEYANNIRLGVEAGMVSSFEECIAGLHCITQRYAKVGEYFEGKDILHEWFLWRLISRSYMSKLQPNVSAQWRAKYGQGVRMSLFQTLVKHLGDPFANLLKYLATEHLSHCVWSSVSSGLASRPLSYVYFQGVANLSLPTTRKLPLGERLNGSRAYERIVTYFTTTVEDTPDSVHKLGWDMLKQLYPKVIDIAKNVSGISKESQAVTWFKHYINSSKMYFNREPFPANESNQEAHKRCKNKAAAKVFCPVRMAVMEKWFEYTRSVLSKVTPRLVNMFHFVGPRKTTPSCPVELDINFMATMGAQTYSYAGHECRKPAKYHMPFFLDRMGPVYSELTVNVHEARPGHHTQSQGYAEHFLDKCGPLLGFLSKSRYTAYSEGWALYAESPLVAEDTALYEGRPMEKYGMIKWQIWRALRLIVDTGLHYKGMSRDQALGLFAKYAWDNTDVAKKEVTRYQSGPGQATAYMIGQLALIRMRKKARKRLGRKFKLKDFHYYVLSRGSAPLSYIAEQVDLYSKCTLDKSAQGCQEFVFADEHYIRSHASSSDILRDEDLIERLMSPEIHEI